MSVVPKNILKEALESVKDKASSNGQSKKGFPLDAFPQPIELLIADVSNSSGFAPEYVAGSLLSVFSSLAGNNFKVQLKPGWIEPGILWIALVGDPGTNKSQSIDFAMNPVWDIDKKLYADYKNAIEAWEKAKEMANGAKFEEPKPTLKQTIVDDITMEALCEVLKENPNGLLKYSDELVGWLNSMDQYRKGSDGAKWLSIYGNKNIVINRIMRGATLVENAYVSVIGGIQPDVLQDLAKDSRKGNGFVTRINYMFPETYQTSPFISPSPCEEMIRDYHRAVGKIHPSNVMSDRVVFMSKEANDLYSEWHEKTRMKMEKKTDSDMREIYSKSMGQCARIALIFQVMKFAYNTESGNEISKESMEGAIKLTRYFRSTCARVLEALDAEAPPIVLEIAKRVNKGESYRSISEALNVSPSMITKHKKKYSELFANGQEVGEKR